MIIYYLGLIAMGWCISQGITILEIDFITEDILKILAESVPYCVVSIIMLFITLLFMNKAIKNLTDMHNKDIEQIKFAYADNRKKDLELIKFLSKNNNKVAK